MPVSKPNIQQALEDHVFFGGLSEDERRAVIDRSQLRDAPKKSILFHHGDPYRGFYVVISGIVQIYRLGEDGRKMVLHVIRPGESFAEVPLFQGHPDPTYPATAETLEDTSLLFLPAESFLDFVDAHPRACLSMLGHMSRRLRSMAGRITSVSLQDVQSRLARYLLYQISDAAPGSEEDGATVSLDAPEVPYVDLDIPKTVLAAEIGTVPETLSRALSDLDDEGLICSKDDRIELTDMEALRLLARPAD